MTTEFDIIEAYPNSVDHAWKIVEVANRLNIDASWLANIIQSESTHNPQALNQYSNAAGLIQFIPSTAQSVIKRVYGLDLTPSDATSYILSLSAVEQMDLVYDYLSRKGELKSQSDVVLAVFYPYAIGRGNDFNIADHYAYRNGRYPRDTREYRDRYDYLVRTNGGITYAGDYTAKLSGNWKLIPAPPYNGDDTIPQSENSKIPSIAMIGGALALLLV